MAGFNRRIARELGFNRETVGSHARHKEKSKLA